MEIEEKLARIKRGNTAPGVNRALIEYLLSTGDVKGPVLDVPCGSGVFLDSLKDFFPDIETFGIDIDPPERSAHKLLKADLSSRDQITIENKFNVVTSISGVMEFDNTLNFLKQLRDHIAEDGLLIVTNDNLLSVRDRVLYLLTGRFRQYPMFVADNAPTWKILPLQNLLRILIDAGFELMEIRYVRVKPTEWLWLPPALPIYLFQMLSFALGKDKLSYKEKAARYPFASLFSRHYFVTCRPVAGRSNTITSQPA